MKRLKSEDDLPSDKEELVAYALILALIAVVALVALLLLGGQINQIISTLPKLPPASVGSHQALS